MTGIMIYRFHSFSIAVQNQPKSKHSLRY